MMTRYYFIFIIFLLSGCASTPEPEKAPYLSDRAASYMHSGINFYEQYNYSGARSQFTKALYDYQSFQNMEGIIQSRLNLSQIAIDMGLFDAAKKHLNRSRYIVQQTKQLSYFNVNIDLLESSMLIRKRNYPDAQALLDTYLSEQSDNTLLDSAIHFSFIVNRTRLAFLTQEDEEKWLEQFKSLDHSQSASYQQRLLRFEAKLLIKQSKYLAALKKLNEALEAYRKDANPKGVSASLRLIGSTHLLLKDSNSAENAYSSSLYPSYKLRDRSALKEALGQLESIYNENNKPNKANTVKRLLLNLSKDDWNIDINSVF